MRTAQPAQFVYIQACLFAAGFQIQSAPLVSVFSFLFTFLVGAPFPYSSLPKTSSPPQSLASTAIDPPEESRRTTQRFLACLCFSRFPLFFFMDGFSRALDNLCTLDVSSVICLVLAFLDRLNFFSCDDSRKKAGQSQESVGTNFAVC